MTDETENRGYNRPQKGARNWHEPINENWDAIDADVAELFSQVTNSAGRPDTIVAETAAEIQPAIDELASGRGGVVQLAAKTYYPETTLWIKSGVTLQGVRKTSQSHNRRIPHIGGGGQGEPIRSTVLSTAEMATGAGAYSYEHDAENPHPHFPVIANYQAKPVVDGEPNEYDRTTPEYDDWGADIGVRNLIIDAEKTRWWEYDRHGADSVYNASRNIDGVDMSDEDWATYFGVYDAVIFEATSNVLVENVETRQFKGYGALFKDVDPALDRGSNWQGGSTDYHGSALSLDHDKQTHSWVRGTWDVDVSGPTPALELNGYTQSNFVSGAWSDATIQGHSHSYLGDSDAFWNGDAPLTSTTAANSTIYYKQTNSRIDGYRILAPGRGGGQEGTVDGIYLADDDAIITNCAIQHARSAFVTRRGNSHHINNCRVFRCGRAIKCQGVQPQVNGLTIEQCDAALEFTRRDDRQGTFNGLTMKDVGVAIEHDNNRLTVLNYPDFNNVDEFGVDFDELVINTPVGYETVSGFPDRHKPS